VVELEHELDIQRREIIAGSLHNNDDDDDDND